MKLESCIGFLLTERLLQFGILGREDVVLEGGNRKRMHMAKDEMESG